MPRLGISLVLLLVLVSNAGAQYVIDGIIPAWGVKFEEAHRALSRNLLDPRSAQYKGMALVPNERGGVLCGWMNWRGENGAYGHFVAFYYRAEAGGVREAHVSSLGVDDEMPEDMQNVGCTTQVMRAGL